MQVLQIATLLQQRGLIHFGKLSEPKRTEQNSGLINDHLISVLMPNLRSFYLHKLPKLPTVCTLISQPNCQ